MEKLITDQQTLSSFCQAILEEGTDYITVDTEFIRESTFWPKLCLIQVASPTHLAAIDPLADLDLAPFLDLMQNPQITKVFHAAYQDVEIFYHLTGKTPTPLFDTQVAAMVAGYGESISYEALVNSLAKSNLDKASRFTDWSKRPLTDRQLEYALGDVIHLRVIYQKLKQDLEKRNRIEWIAEEMAILSDPQTYSIDPREAWKKIRYRSLKAKALAVLREVATVRDQEAQRRDVPRARVMKDESLLEIAASIPHSIEDLMRIRGINAGQAKGPLGENLLKAVQKALSLPPEHYPEPHKKRPPSIPGQSAMVEMLKVLLKIKSEQHHVASKLLATAKELEDIAREEKPHIPALQGWRYKIFGKDALDLKNGKIALTIQNGEIKMIEL